MSRVTLLVSDKTGIWTNATSSKTKEFNHIILLHCTPNLTHRAAVKIKRDIPKCSEKDTTPHIVKTLIHTSDRNNGKFSGTLAGRGSIGFLQVSLPTTHQIKYIN